MIPSSRRNARLKFLRSKTLRQLEALYEQRQNDATQDYEQINPQPDEADLGEIETLLESVYDMDLIQSVMQEKLP